ncbi:hypothetical protein O181_075089 [Austropuccinia psidii MF-1]|uniref:Uncharacterized protein n=1 Tax=Austropuccinia psidii MF-1 TaxID=1389203 RepID=A0A9Q3IE39_9BASI|nr:hypothetical protein [Austropuccinia psidii MF-1]
MDQKGHLCPRPPNEKGWPRNKDKDLGLGDMEELAKESKDGSIWPKAIKGQGIVIWPKCHRELEGAELAIKISCGQLVPGWNCHNTNGGGSFFVIVTVPPYLEW